MTEQLQCPYCADVPAICLSQEGLNQLLINLGYYFCTAEDPWRLVKPHIVITKADTK
jgi:hypothetical protein